MQQSHWVNTADLGGHAYENTDRLYSIILY